GCPGAGRPGAARRGFRPPSLAVHRQATAQHGRRRDGYTAPMTSEDVSPFGYLRLAGGRFDAAEGLPVTSAAELERYALLVSTVARELYLRAHPKRQRVPRGFDQAFDLRLTRVGRGSQIPVLVRPTVNDGGLFENTDWHDDARR